LDIPREEASARLKTGDIDFILRASPSRMGELARLDPAAPFYAGLRVKAAGEGGLEQIRADALFEAALESPLVRAAAAGDLLDSLLAAGDNSPAGNGSPAGELLERIQGQKVLRLNDPEIRTLRAAVLYRLGRFDELSRLYARIEDRSPWDRALLLAASLRSGVTDTADLPGFFFNSPLGAAQRWGLGEIQRIDAESLSTGEAAAISGRFALARSSFTEGLDYFRVVLDQDAGLFFHYPELLSDLGRAFQFTAAREEGTALFLSWDDQIQAGSIPAMDGGSAGTRAETAVDSRRIRYLLLYFAGRIQRQAQRYDRAAELFIRALAFVPDPLQEDACMWYILNVTLTGRPQDTVSLLRSYAPRWHSGIYFADILDRLSRYLTANRRWETMGEVFSLIQNRSDGETLAKYAYILGRATAEGYLPGDHESAGAFFKIAFEEGTASWYYRALGAFHLGENTIPIPPDDGSGGAIASEDLPFGEELEFLLGFFKFGVPDRVFAYLEDDMDRFSIPELRVLAEAFAGASLWAESIRLVSAYMSREEYTIQRRDMELLYPRPFSDLIETHAREAELPVEILYGLVRTESAFVPDIRSWAGAVGLTQLMPATALDMAGRIRRRGGPDYTGEGEIALWEPEVNIHLGAVYLRYLMDRTESPLSALLAYNGGIGRIRRWRAAEDRLPEDLFLETIEYAETREYGRKVLAAAAAYGYLYYDMTMESFIADILR
jgi:soluble lytic murein transglycosylase